MPVSEYALVSLQEYDEPADVGEYFEIPSWAHTDTAQKSEEKKVGRHEGETQHISQYMHGSHFRP